VLTEKTRGALRLAAVDRQALAFGLTPGLALADARARLPDLVAVEHDPAADLAFLGRLADACDRYTPLVALDEPGGLVLDITGCAHLFGGEATLRADLHARLKGVGLSARSAIAGTPEAARANARFGAAGIVPPGADAEVARPLPVAALEAEAEAALALTRAGLKTIGDLADRPSELISARFGEALTTRLARLTGREDRRITPRRAPPPYLVERRFAEPIGREEDMLATLSLLAGRAILLLEQRGEGGRRFEASFFRTDGAVRRIAVEAGRPLREVQALQRLFRERIGALADPIDPGFGFDLIRLAVMHAEPFETAQASLDGHEQADEDTAALIDRLAARFGRASVLRFAHRNTHRPERAEALVPALEAGPPWPPAGALPPLERPLQIFDPPQAVETLAEVPDGPPITFRWRRVTHQIARAEGPERIAAEWWRDGTEAFTRDYYRVEDAEGRRFWLYRDGLYGREAEHPRWFLHGLFA
jgi:protein ImuB